MVSVVIPAYNCSSYIGDAIDSVLRQSYQDFEIIVIDDGSTDGTGELVRTRYPIVRYVKKDNGGASSARNEGIRLSKGEYIAFLDSDDIWMPDKLEKQIAAFGNDSRIGMVFTDNDCFIGDKRLPSNFDKHKHLMTGDFVRNVFLYSHVATPTVMVKREVFDTVGYFDQGLATAEDDNMWMRISLNYPVSLINEILVSCGLSPNSLSRTPGNIYKGVFRNIQLITTKYPLLYERLKDLISIKLAKLMFETGYTLFNKGENKASRRFFLSSIKYNFYNSKAHIYLFCSFLPNFVFKNIRKLRNYAI